MITTPHTFAYLFERFPSFVQTFVYREAGEMIRQGMNPLLVSIRRPDDAKDVREEFRHDIVYLPESEELRAQIESERESFSGKQRNELSEWRKQEDSTRIFEALWLGRLLQEKGIRHVHAHFGALAARTAWFVQRLWGITFSFTGHANDIFCDTDYPVSNAMLANDAKFVVTETDYARQWMETKYPAITGKVFRVFNGIDLDGFPPHAEAPGPPRIISVGRFVEKKGFPELIRACAMLVEYQLDFRCDIIGEGPMNDAMRAEIQRLNLDDKVSLLGPFSQSEVRERMAEARIFVLAAKHDADGGSDNLPTVIMEAMACGTPVVSTRVAGIPEMVDHGESGLLVDEGDVSGFAESIEQLLREPHLAPMMGAAAIEKAREKFAIENSVNELIRLLAKFGNVPLPSEVATRFPEAQVSWWKRMF